MLLIVVAVVVVIIILGAAWALSARNSAAPNSSGGSNPGGNAPPPPETVVASGTVWTLNAGQYEYLEFTTSATGALTGSFTATNGVTAYVMDPSEYASFSSSSSASSYVYTTGHVSSGSMNTNLGSGSYYLVLENTNLITTTSVDWTSDCAVTF